MPPQPPAAFISYCRDDQEFALRLAQDLKSAGAAVWIDQIDIAPGVPWDNAIENALIASPRMLLVLSPASSRSQNVRNEISFTLEQGKIVIPVLYRDCIVPLQLQRNNRIDFRADYAKGLAQLLPHLQVAHPNQAVLDKAAEDDAHRQAAWQAREAEAERLRHREEKAAWVHEDAFPVADDKPPVDLSSRRDPLLSPPVPRSANLAGKAPTFQPWLWSKASWTGLAGGVAALIVIGLVAVRPTSSVPASAPTEGASANSPSTSALPQRPGPSAAPQPAVPARASNPDKTTVKEPVASTAVNQGHTFYRAGKYKEARPLLTQQCDAGSPAACGDLAEIYLIGHGVPNDADKAMQLYGKACEGGIAESCFQVAYNAENKRGDARNIDSAVSFYTKACDLGYGHACDHLGIDINLPFAGGKDKDKARNFLAKACDLNDSDGCADLGNLYSYGSATQDYSLALKFYKKACGPPREAGCDGLGILYRDGEGVEVNRDLALKYFQEGCHGGWPSACKHMDDLNKDHP